MQLLTFPELPSTNDYLKQHIQELETCTAVRAEIQTAGKGRLGKTWVSPPGNLYQSMLFRNQSGDVSLFPLLCALAGAQTLQEVCDCEVLIKWPNDLILNQKKICGILCESMISSSQIHIICGIGINVNQRADQFEESALPYATSLLIELGKSFDPARIGQRLAENLALLADVFHKEGFASLKEPYEQKLVSHNREIQVLYQQETVRGICLGIADNGNLLCRKDNGDILMVNSGEASVRGLYGYV